MENCSSSKNKFHTLVFGILYYQHVCVLAVVTIPSLTLNYTLIYFYDNYVRFEVLRMLAIKVWSTNVCAYMAGSL